MCALIAAHIISISLSPPLPPSSVARFDSRSFAWDFARRLSLSIGRPSMDIGYWCHIVTRVSRSNNFTRCLAIAYKTITSKIKQKITTSNIMTTTTRELEDRERGGEKKKKNRRNDDEREDEEAFACRRLFVIN